MPDTLLQLLRRCAARLRGQPGMTTEAATDIARESLVACLCWLRRQYPDEIADDLSLHLPPALFEAVVRKRVADHYRHQRCEQHAIAEWMKQLSVLDSEQRTFTLLLANEIWDALPENCRQVVYLRIYEQCSWDEIAQVTGLGVSAAKMRFQRGIEQAQKKLGVTCDESSPSNDFFIGSTLAGETAYTPDGGENSNATTDLPLEHCPDAGAGESDSVAHHRRQPRASRGGTAK